MTIQEIIQLESVKHGKPFIRKGWEEIHCYIEQVTSLIFIADENNKNFRFLAEDILAEDWEIKEDRS